MKEPLHDHSITHGICPVCSLRQQLNDQPTLVISRRRIHTMPLLQGLLRGTPEIRIVVDRRVAERRQSARLSLASERRRQIDRRRSSGFVLV